MWWKGQKLLCESNLENNLLNKIYVYEIEISLEKNH